MPILEEDTPLQHDGPHQHFRVVVLDFVNRKFLWKWTGSRGGPKT